MKEFNELKAVVIKLRGVGEELKFPYCDWTEKDKFFLIYPEERPEIYQLAAATDRVEYIYYKYELIQDCEEENEND